MTLSLALVLALLQPVSAAELEVKAVGFLPTAIGADLGPLKAGPTLDFAAPITLRPALGSPLGAEAIAPLAPALTAMQAPAAQAQIVPLTISQALTAQNEVISKALTLDASGLSARDGVDKIYFGSGQRRGGSSFAGSFDGASAEVAGSDSHVTPEGLTVGVPGDRGRTDPSSKAATFILNDEKIPITGRAADYYQETKRLERVLSKKGVNLQESTDVMDDAFRDTLGKLKIIEKVGAQDALAQNMHLPETLTWVDAVMNKNGEKTAVHTTQVYFHHAEGDKKSASEIAEGVRRIDKNIEQQLEFFKKGGKADQEIAKLAEDDGKDDGRPLDKVILGFDARGYKEIKDHIKAKEAEIRAVHGDRFSFVFLDDKDSTLPQEEVRKQLTTMVKKYKGHGLQRIVEGVTYSRYTGLLLELKGIEWRLAQGATIVQSGRDMFNDGVDHPERNGMYETELDVVSRAKDGRLDMDEEKSARVVLHQEDVLSDKFLYKLEAYKRNRGLIERQLGGIPRINFVIDVGGLDRQSAYEGQVKWKNSRQLELVRFLQSKEAELSAQYGFEVHFVFLSSYPGVDPLLMEKWLAANPDKENDKALLKAQRREDRKAKKGRR